MKSTIRKNTCSARIRTVLSLFSIPAFVFQCILLMSADTQAQENKKLSCDTLKADLDSGTVSRMRPDLPVDTLKVRFPCYSDYFEHPDESLCGSELRFNDQDFSVFTDKNFFEIRKHFKGTINYQLFGHDEEYLQSVFGPPVQVTDVQKNDEAPLSTVYSYKKFYGTLLVWLNSDEGIYKVQLFMVPNDKVEFCR